MADGFLNELKVELIGERNGRAVWRLLDNLYYRRGDTIICCPYGLETDFASVPRVPIAYAAWGDRAHREAILHDYLYRADAYPLLKRSDCDLIFKEAMISRGKPWTIYQPMYWGVRLGGGSSYHRLRVKDSII
jgi:hypothetical protein